MNHISDILSRSTPTILLYHFDPIAADKKAFGIFGKRSTQCETILQVKDDGSTFGVPVCYLRIKLKPHATN